MKKKYTIKVKHNLMRVLVGELKLWGVDESRYKVDGDEITTSDSNVVDVATETFIKDLSLVNIKEE